MSVRDGGATGAVLKLCWTPDTVYFSVQSRANGRSSGTYRGLRDQQVARVVGPVGHLVLLMRVGDGVAAGVLALRAKAGAVVHLVAAGGWGAETGIERRVVWLVVLAVGQHADGVVGVARRVGRAVEVVVVMMGRWARVKVETAVCISAGHQ